MRVLLAFPLPASPALAQTADDRSAIVEASDALDAAVDGKDRERARELFANTITVPLPGSEARETASSELVGMWRGDLHEAKASFPLRGNHVVTFDDPGHARVRSKAHAWNRVEGPEGGDLRDVRGDCDCRMVKGGDGWRISPFAFAPAHSRNAVPTYKPE